MMPRRRHYPAPWFVQLAALILLAVLVIGWIIS